MSRVAIRLWEKMTEIYGDQWVRKYGDTPNDTWASMCESVAPTVIRDAITECIKKNNFPPSLPEFGGYIRDLQRIAKQREDSTPQLPRIMSEREREQARDVIAKASPKKASRGNRRTLLLPGESYADYSEALAASGKSTAEFRRERLAMNGWADEDEAGFLLHLGMLGLRSRYGPADNEDFIGRSA